MHRRDFLLMSSASALALTTGCSTIRPVQVTGLPPVPIDIHAHMFNGRDIPVTGFLEQVFLRHPEAPIEDVSSIRGLINLLKFIFLTSTPTATDEFRDIKGGAARITRAEDWTEADKASLARGITAFEADVTRKSAADAGVAALRTGPTPDEIMLGDLQRRAGSGTFGIRTDKTSATDLGARIAERTFAKPGGVRATVQSITGGGGTTLFDTLRWATLLTRSRRGILFELKELFGKTDEIGVFSPSIVDFELWLRADEGNFAPSPQRDQIDVMARIARQETDVVLLHFASFCPLRAAVDARAGRDPLANVKHAMKNGFAGVKLYPPMGFRPIRNLREARFGQKRGRKATGAELNTQLRNLYKWCVDNDVPIKSHANNSLDAQPCSAQGANPGIWAEVYAEGYTDLRVNAAHFGGFEETTMPREDCSGGPTDWDETAAGLANRNPNVYLDVGFWTEVTRIAGGRRGQYLALMRDLLARNPNLPNQIMYGSDWSMIGRLKNHEYYLADVKRAFEELGLPLQAMMHDNAKRYLGLDREGVQLDRLRRFFGPKHKFAEYFGR